MVPSGGLQTAITNLLSPGKLQAELRSANEWVKNAIASVRSVPDNPYKDDEEIAAAILKGIEEKSGRKCSPR